MLKSAEERYVRWTIFFRKQKHSSSATSIRAQVEKIVASDAFAKSENSINFLRYIVNETLEGRGDELKESIIGIDVFKIKDFDPRVHTSVRKEASRLRERLEEYYSQAGSRDAIRIEVPKGAYKPVIAGKPGRLIPRWVMWVAAGALIVVLSDFAYKVVSRWIEEYFAQQHVQIPQQKHVVVLPFTSVGSNPAASELRQGLLFTVTSRLAQIERFEKGFWVVPASAILASGVGDAVKACHTFGANLALTGSVERSGQRTRMTASLIYCLGEQQKHLSSRIVDSQLMDAFVLQDEVVRNVIEMLALKLGEEARNAILPGGSVEPRAEDFYLQARGYLLRGTDGVDNAIALFRQALQEDPNYALAHAGLGESYLQKYDIAKDPQWVDMARASCRQAIQINSRLVPVYMTQGLIYAATGHYTEAINEYRSALEIDPQSADAYHHLASAYDKLGRIQEAEDTYTAAIQRRGDWGTYKDLGVFHSRRGQYSKAERAFLEAKRLAPDNFEVYYDLGGIYLELSRYGDAVSNLERSLALKPNAVAYNNLSAVYFYQKHYADAG
jgi:tetratricopeptide (TPR) repeat protein